MRSIDGCSYGPAVPEEIELVVKAIDESVNANR